MLAKQEGREYRGGDGSAIPAGTPDNPYGRWWIDLGDRVCIHATPETLPARGGLGCISLKTADAADLYGILSIGSKVTIRSHRTPLFRAFARVVERSDSGGGVAAAGVSELTGRSTAVYDKQALMALVREKALQFGDFTLASGKKASYYLDCRRVTLDSAGANLIAEGFWSCWATPCRTRWAAWRSGPIRSRRP